jgi:hypothetical protein
MRPFRTRSAAWLVRLAAIGLAAPRLDAADSRFYTVIPCRIVDTRTSANAPALAAGATRHFAVAGVCGTSPTASAVAVNVTATGATLGGHLRLFPKGQTLPTSSVINYVTGQTRANNAIVAVGDDGAVSVYAGQASGTVHLVLDVNAYVDDPANNQPPVVTAGPSQTVTLPATASLTATAKDDGKPSGALTYSWSLASGPAAVAFSAPKALSTTITLSSPGTYVVRFTASDSQLASSADVTLVAQSSLGPPKTGGQYHLGPVDFAETEWTNACSPYPASLFSVTGLGGELLAGVSHTYSGGGSVCDACLKITTATGRTQVARVVTYGDTPHPSNLDVSPSVYQSLNTGEYPRSMSWEFTPCPTTSPLYYQFQTASSIWWTSFWVRNPKVPVTKVEVKGANHSSFVELRRETDGTFNDDGGFGSGPFTLRITGMDGQVLTETLPGFSAGQIIMSTVQFR